jgi:hypothetical protein
VHHVDSEGLTSRFGLSDSESDSESGHVQAVLSARRRCRSGSKGRSPAATERVVDAGRVSSYALQGLYSGLEILNSPSEKFVSLVG